MSYEAAIDPGDDSRVNVNATCKLCLCRSFVRLDKGQFMQWWVKGEEASQVWPELAPGDLELIKDGTHPDCYDNMMKEKDASRGNPQSAAH